MQVFVIYLYKYFITNESKQYFIALLYIFISNSIYVHLQPLVFCLLNCLFEDYLHMLWIKLFFVVVICAKNS